MTSQRPTPGPVPQRTGPSLAAKIRAHDRGQQVAEVFAREGLEGLQKRGLLNYGPQPTLGEGLGRATRGLPTIIGGAFTEEGMRASSALTGQFYPGARGEDIRQRIDEKVAQGTSRESAAIEVAQEGLNLPSWRLPQWLREGLSGPSFDPTRQLIPETVGVQGALEAAAPVPLGGPIAGAAVKVGVAGAKAGYRAAKPVVAAAARGARAAAPVARRALAKEGGFVRLPGGAPDPNVSGLPKLDEEIKVVEARIQANRRKPNLKAQQEVEADRLYLDEVKNMRREILLEELPVEEVERYKQLEYELSQAEAELDVMIHNKPMAAPRFGSRERAEWDASRRERGIPIRATAKRKAFLRGEIDGLQREIKEIEAGMTLPEAPAPAAGPGPTIQAGMGIGEAPPQGSLFENLRGEAQRVELADPEQLLARQERAALAARGQAEMPLAPATPVTAAAKEPWQMMRAEWEAAQEASRVPGYAYRRTGVDAYKQAVVEAMESGKPVPPEVKAQFPDLAVEAPAPSAAVPPPGVAKGGLGERRIPPAKAPVTAPRPVPAQAPAPAPVAQAAPAQPSVQPAAAGGTPPPPVQPPVAQAAAPPPPPKQPEFAANIRLSKFTKDIHDDLIDWAKTNPDEVERARRGVRSDAQVLADAERLIAEQGGDLSRLRKQWKAGKAYNAEELTAIRGVLNAKRHAALLAREAAHAVPTAENQAKFAVALLDAGNVQSVVHGVTAEAGRALRSFRNDAMQLSGKGTNAEWNALLDRVLQVVGGDQKKLDLAAAAMAKLDLNNPRAVNDFIWSLNKPKFWDYLFEVVINGWLSGPRSHIINFGTNMGNALGVRPTERVLAAGVERVLAPLQGRQVDRFFSEVPADLFGSVAGLKEGARAGFAVLRGGYTPGAVSKYEFRRIAFRGNLGRVIRAPGTALEAADALWYGANYRAALQTEAVRMARREGLRGAKAKARWADIVANPSVKLVAKAQKSAEYYLFRQEPGPIGKWLMQGRVVLPPLRFVVPFLRTPINIFKFGIERSPLGLANPGLWRNLAAKNPEASDQIARVFLGSILAALIAWKFSDGTITGRAPKSAAARDRFFREGKQAYAVRIGDKWIQYQRVEPFNMNFAMVAAALHAIEDKDKTREEKIEDAILTIGQNLTSQTYMTAVSDLLNFFEEPERYTTSMLGRLASGLMPFSALARTTAQVADPTFRRPRTIGQQLQSQVPGLSGNVPPRLTAFGQEAPRLSPAISPVSITPAQQTAVDAALEATGVEVGFVGSVLGGETLTPEQRDEYQRLAGAIIYRDLSAVVGSGGFKALPKAAQENMLERTINSAREKGRLMMRLRLALAKKPEVPVGR